MSLRSCCCQGLNLVAFSTCTLSPVLFLQLKFRSIIFFFWDHNLVVHWAYSYPTPGGTQGIIYGARDPTWVNCAQGKSHIGCTIALAPRLWFWRAISGGAQGSLLAWCSEIASDKLRDHMECQESNPNQPRARQTLHPLCYHSAYPL